MNLTKMVSIRLTGYDLARLVMLGNYHESLGLNRGRTSYAETIRFAIRFAHIQIWPKEKGRVPEDVVNSIAQTLCNLEETSHVESQEPGIESPRPGRKRGRGRTYAAITSATSAGNASVPVSDVPGPDHGEGTCADVQRPG